MLMLKTYLSDALVELLSKGGSICHVKAGEAFCAYPWSPARFYPFAGNHPHKIHSLASGVATGTRLGAQVRGYKLAPVTEGIAFGDAGRLWAVSEAGSRHIYDHPFLGLFQPFPCGVRARPLSLGVRRI
jgi:hypothetical protein